MHSASSESNFLGFCPPLEVGLAENKDEVDNNCISIGEGNQTTLRKLGKGSKIKLIIFAEFSAFHRQQAVVVEGRISPLSEVISGVPQGTV